MKIEKLSQFVALLAWITVIMMAWLIFMRTVPNDALSLGLWIFFLVLAGLSSAVSLPRQRN